MNKNGLLAVALISGLCLSGQNARIDHSEIAMAKCTKSSECDVQEKDSGRSKKSCKKSKTQGDKEVKGAARKVVEGDDTAANELRRSAARKVVEEEIAFLQ